MLHTKLNRVDDEWRQKNQQDSAASAIDYRTTDERMLRYQRQCDERSEEAIKREVQRIRCVEPVWLIFGCEQVSFARWHSAFTYSTSADAMCDIC